jgi:hypothetical protein
MMFQPNEMEQVVALCNMLDTQRGRSGVYVENVEILDCNGVRLGILEYDEDGYGGYVLRQGDA